MADDTRSDLDELEDEMEAMAVWENHLKGAPDRLKEGVAHSEDDYRQGLADFPNVDESEISEQVSHECQRDVTQMSSDEFARQVTDEGDDWLLGLYEGVTGREPPEQVERMAKEIDDEVIAQSGEQPEGEQLADEIRQKIQNRAGRAG